MEKSGRPESVNVGLYELRIDDKARIILPGTFRQTLGRSFIISTGFDLCLYLMAEKAWSEYAEKELARWSDFSAEARRVSRFFHSSAHRIEADSQNRFVIPPPLRKYAALERDIVVTGARTRVEIWSRKIWDEYSAKSAGMIEEIAGRLAADIRV